MSVSSNSTEKDSIDVRNVQHSLSPNGAVSDRCLRTSTVQVMATSNAEGGFKRFSGAGANRRDLKRWKTCCLSKMITMTSLRKEGTGPFVYSMRCRQWNILEFAEFEVDGETLLLNIFEARYLDKDPIDRAGKALFDSRGGTSE